MCFRISIKVAFQGGHTATTFCSDLPTVTMISINQRVASDIKSTDSVVALLKKMCIQGGNRGWKQARGMPSFRGTL